MSKIIKISYLTAMLMFLGLSSVHAALVSFTASGTVTGASANDFALSVSDSVSTFGTFDDAGFTGTGQESFTLSTLSLGIGTANFTEADAIGLTEIVFSEGAFLGFNFSTAGDVAGPIAFFDSTFDFFSGEDDLGGFVDGAWDSASYSVIPVPAALWLFGSGLIGLVGLLRRRQRT